MLQVFRMDVAAKVDGMLHTLQWLYAYVANSVPNVSSVFFTYVTSVFTWMLHMVHTYVASVLS
jgi:hypothetical protein